MATDISDETQLAKALLDRFESGEDLPPDEIDTILNHLHELGLDAASDQSIFLRLVRQKATRLLAILNSAGDPVSAFGDEAERTLTFLTDAFSQNWFEEEEDTALVDELFHLRVGGLIHRINGGDEIKVYDDYFLISSFFNNKLDVVTAAIVCDRFALKEPEPEREPEPIDPDAVILPRIETRKAGPVPLNFSIERFEVFIGYVKDGSGFKMASVYGNGRHQIAIKIAIKLDEFDEMGKPSEVDIDHLVSSLYINYYGNGRELNTEVAIDSIFYRRERNRFCYLLNPRWQNPSFGGARRLYVDTLPDGTIVTEFYISAQGNPYPKGISLAAGLKTDKGHISTGKHSTNTQMANGSNWTQESYITIDTLKEIDYAKVENIRLEDKHNQNASMWKNRTDLNTIYSELFTDSYSAVPLVGGSNDYHGQSAKGETYIRPAIEDFGFELKSVRKRYGQDDLSVVLAVPADAVYWEGGDSIKTSFLFVERSKWGVESGSIFYWWGYTCYNFKMRNYSNNYDFRKHHVFYESMKAGRIRVSFLAFILDKSNLHSTHPYVEQSEGTEVEVYDTCGNYGVVSVSVRAPDWPSVRINGAII